MTASNLLFYFCIAFIVGIGLATAVKIPQTVGWGILVVGVLFIVISMVAQQYPKIKSFEILGIAGFCILFLALGIARVHVAEFTITKDSLRAYRDVSQKVTLVGVIIADPDVRDTYQRLKVKINKTNSVVLVTVGRQTEFQYLDSVNMTGFLKTPPMLDDFNYKNYLMKEGVYSVMDFPAIEITLQEHHYTPLSFIYEKILLLKRALLRSLDKSFSGAGNYIMQGVVFGNDATMPKELKNQFQVTGLSHVTAVSGGNIVILIIMLTFVLLALGFWRQHALVGAMLFIWLYIALIGFPASGIRAAMMGSVALLGGVLGRQNTSSRVLTITAALMVMQNPFVLLYDIGFQLSFLASAGIIYGKPFVDRFIQFDSEIFLVWIKNEKIKSFFVKHGYELQSIVSVTIVAQIFTLPIIVYYFGNVSLVALLANVLVLPIIPWLMGIGFVAAILGIFSGFLGWVAALPCYALLWYFLNVLDFLNMPLAMVSVGSISFGWVAFYYIALAAVIWWLQKKLQPSFLEY